MAKFFSDKIRVYFDGYDPGTLTTSVTPNLEVANLDPTCLGDTGRRAVAGVRQDTLEWAGLYDDSGSDNVDAMATALIGSGAKTVSVLYGTGTGSAAYAGSAHLHMRRTPVAVADLVRESLTFVMDSKFDKCIVLASKVEATASGTLGTVDNAALTTAGGTAYLHVHSYTGTGTAVLGMRHSADGTTWVTLTTANLGTMTGTKLSTTGTVRRYVQAFASAITGEPTGDAVTYSIVFNRG